MKKINFTHPIKNSKKHIKNNLNFLKGIVIGNPNGFGFVRIKGEKNDFYLSPGEMKKTLHGDTVLIKSFKKNKIGKIEAKILKILTQANKYIIGEYFLDDQNKGYVLPNDQRLLLTISIPKEKSNRAKIGNIVVTKLITRPSKKTNATGKIIEILGNKMSARIAIEVALRKHQIPYIWPKKIKQQISNLENKISASEKQGRIDLRELPLITIDDEEAKDFDDAVYCSSRVKGGWDLWVAIADVSHYVKPKTTLDNEAFSRGNSVYFPLRVIPMLPEILSNKLCSLTPKSERLCIACKIKLSPKGKIISSKFYKAIMKSHARLTYSKTWKILQGNKKLCKYYKNLVPHLKQLYSLYKILNHARIKRGAISFESEEEKFIFNNHEEIENIEISERNEAHKLIEECMILTNVVAARFIEKNKISSLYRVHNKPEKDNIINLKIIFNEFGLNLPGGTNPKSSDYAKIMNKISKKSNYELLQIMMLRSMKQAVYHPNNNGHFGLALKSYTHFTSPIRRYSDLILHRSIKNLISYNKNTLKKHNNVNKKNISLKKNILELGEHCSMTERRAEEATRDVSDWIKCEFMKRKIGSTFNGIIINVTNFGFFVRLKSFLIDGLVHVTSLNDDYYYFDNIKQQLIGKNTKKTYRLGDEIKIKVHSVHMHSQKIHFQIIN